MQVPIPIVFEPCAGSLKDDIRSIPACPGIFSLGTAGNPPHVGRTINLQRRLSRLLVSSYTAETGELSPFAQKTTNVSYWPVASKLESSLILYELTRASYPDSYLHRLHLRMPWFVGLTQTQSFARLEVANRLPRTSSSVRFGPFRTRDEAQFYGEQVQSLFQLRRCAETLLPAPDHPGCIYGEMNQCLRPCQLAVSAGEYETEAMRVAEFLDTRGASALGQLRLIRSRAAEEMDFEQAAQVHKRVEKLQAVAAARDKVVAQADRFCGLAVTKARSSDAVMLWPMAAGYWQAPLELHLPANDGRETRSLDSHLRGMMEDAFGRPPVKGARLEHLALFSRWYYSSWRDGEWFGFADMAQLNYRRLVKAVSELVKPSTTT